MGKGRRYDQDYKDMIVDLFKSGMSVSEISSEYGIAKSTINGWIKDVKEIKVNENEVMTLKEFKQLKKEMKDGCIPDWKDDDDYIEETDENSFECYIDGYYSERHYSISIVEKPMKMSERFMAEISESMISQDMLSQFRTQVLKLKETELLSDAEYEQLLKDNSVAEVIKDKISGDDDFWDAYDSIISEVAREEVVKYTEKE